MTATTADRVMHARRETLCPVCQRPIKVGQLIGRTGVWQHIEHIIERQREDTMAQTIIRDAQGDELVSVTSTVSGHGVTVAIPAGGLAALTADQAHQLADALLRRTPMIGDATPAALGLDKP